MTAPLRFKDDGVYLSEFWDRVWVVSPDGSGPAVVHGNRAVVRHKAELRSFNSALRLNNETAEWYGPVIGTFDSFCPACSRQVAKRSILREKYAKGIKTHVDWKCRCGNEVSRRITWTRLEYTNRPIDPYFGLPLWLQTEVAGEILWAYNLTHLDFLESYVAATIRERGVSSHRVLVSRLPTWMKLAKNRPKVIRGIARLRKKSGALR